MGEKEKNRMAGRTEKLPTDWEGKLKIHIELVRVWENTRILILPVRGIKFGGKTLRLTENVAKIANIFDILTHLFIFGFYYLSII